MVFRQRPPSWFWVIAFLLLLWEMMGLWSFYAHVAHGPEAMGAQPTAYDRRLYASLPRWYNLVFGVATWGGFAGAAALLLRRRISVPLNIASLIGVVVMFGWMFLMTDIIVAKGIWTTYFPAAIFVISVFALWLSRMALARGWIG